ncbi:MAG TPA: transglutaminase-like domain-containing protein, partial [Bacteroidales bacterium]|nr:transglutaminase-like domain-containing protein [Bacteroidales bacterium]
MNKMPPIESLLCLLEDPDESIYKPASEQLINHGRDVVPELEAAWEQSLDILLQERIEEIIHRIQFSSTLKQLEKWTTEGGKNLMEGAWLVARFQYPDLEFRSIQHTVHKLKQDVWLELNDNMTALEQIRVVNHILFQIHGFHGNSSNFYAPQNSFINDVLSSQKGNPISLALIYLYIVQELNIPVYGVDLPKNFILAYLDEYAFTDE